MPKFKSWIFSSISKATWTIRQSLVINLYPILKTLSLPHLLVLLLAFVFQCATDPILDAASMHTDKAHGIPKVIPHPLTRTAPRQVLKHSPVARDLHELPNGWVRTF